MEHDQSYRRLFSHPELIADLLRGYVHESWVEALDFETLERVSATFISKHLRIRESDVIWRVRFHGQWLYVYLLLEFQSGVDRFMALRMWVYLGLLYEDLARRGELTTDGLLPPVVPIVLYNGAARWSAPVEVAELIQPVPGTGLGRFHPSLSYLLFEESRFAADPLPEGRNFEKVNQLTEVRTMLAERVKDWTRSWKEQGLEEGRLEGEAHVLRRLLRRRFGELPGWANQRISAATNTDQLEAWAERLLDAPTLEDVFSA